ncbi:MAG TPA: succinate dehydrogenase assembly factor 2 [Acidiferrobacterales bacterium]
MSDAAYRRLRWRCRRGLLELDLLLNEFLERHYAELSGAEREDFARLLVTPDAVLFEWCSGGVEPDDPNLKHILNKVLQ